MRRAWLMVGMLLLVGTTICLLESAGRDPETIEQAVAETLAGHGITEPDVRILQAACMPSRDTCLRVVADVTVEGQSEIGRLACKRYWTSCTLTMAGYGLHLAPVPDVASPSALEIYLRATINRIATCVDAFRLPGRMWPRCTAFGEMHENSAPLVHLPT